MAGTRFKQTSDANRLVDWILAPPLKEESNRFCQLLSPIDGVKIDPHDLT